MPSGEPTLWELIPAKKLAPEGSPGLMGYLRSQVELPPATPSFGTPTYATLSYDIYYTATNQVVDTQSSLEVARVMCRRLARYNVEPLERYDVRQNVVWGANTFHYYALLYTGGPYNGAYVKTNGQDVPHLFASHEDAAYHRANYVLSTHPTIIVEL